MRRALPRALLPLLLLLGACSQQPLEVADQRPPGDIAPQDVVDAVPAPETLRAAGNKSPYVVRGQEYHVLASATGYRARGIASWYGHKFHGRLTSNGEVYDAYAATAAHRTLPIPSYVRVTNLENGASMVLRVNDRGPFHDQRIIDLSYGAAVKLGFARQGTAEVEVVALSVDGTRDLRGDAVARSNGVNYRYVQVGSFGDENAAMDLRAEIHQRLQLPVVVARLERDGQTWHRVRVGPIDDPERLLGVQQQLAQLGFPDARMMPE